MSPASYFFDEGELEYTFGERSWNTSRPTASPALSCPTFYEPDLGANPDGPFARDASGKLIRRSYWLDMTDRSLVMVMVNGIGAHLTNDEKRAHLIDLKRHHLIDQVCVQEILPQEK
jgi:hypothetical protein